MIEIQWYIFQFKSVSKNVRLMERKDICYFNNIKMFNNKNDNIFI